MIGFVRRVCYLRWRKKAVKRALEIRRLNKRILELEESREDWKNKANQYCEEKNAILKELKKNQ
jgi:lipase chaperone LimK